MNFKKKIIDINSYLQFPRLLPFLPAAKTILYPLPLLILLNLSHS
jgi:hypothetical protein